MLSSRVIVLFAALCALAPSKGQATGFETGPLTGLALQNVTAFTRLFGYVRYFHPSDQAAAANWEAFAVYGMGQVEGAQTPAELANTLQTLFAPIAPTVLVYPTGQTPPVPPALQPGSTTGLSVVRWSYVGFPSSGSSPYSAARISGQVVNGRIPAGFSDPASAFVADLGAGVSSFVPVDLYSNAQGTLPRPTASLPSLPGPPWTVSVRAVRLALLAEAWNVPQHFYPYFDVVNTDWGQALGTALTSAASAPDEPSFYNALCQLGAALHDGHFSINTGRMSSGSPLYLPPLAWDWIEGSLVVTYVADSQGQAIQPGDAILSIDGQSVTDLIASAEKLISGASRQWLLFEALTQIGAGASGSTMQMQIESAGQQRNVAMRRTNGTSLWEPLGAVPEPRPQAIAQVLPGIYYVDVTRVTTAQWNAALPSLSAASGIVFDYRGYPQPMPESNLVASPGAGIGLLIPTPLLPDRIGLGFNDVSWGLYPAQPLLPGRAVFLTDGRAISFAETSLILAAGNHLGDIVGGPSAGTDGNVTAITLFNLYYMGFTAMKTLNADGSQFHGIGVRPTVPVMRTRAGVAAGKDEVLERGLALLQNPSAHPVGPWVASAASYLPESACPGALLSIFAPAIGPQSAATMQLTPAGLVDTTLNGTRVWFDGYPAPLLYVGPAQVNLVVPFELAGSAHTQMTVEYQGQPVLSLGLALVPSAPSVFALNGSGIGPGAILNQDSTVNSATNPADRGTVIQIFATGAGPWDTVGVDGSFATAPLAHPALPVSVRIGGLAAEVDYAGAAPGLVSGVLQVNARIPAGVAPGKAAVFIAVGDAASQPGITVYVP
ncbi:MAG TPA: hypothetical protein VKF41_09455 [Bryobacteraceae bacterium]|nr:hypothetical protein [Bryobacteraceae bacterium]